MGASVAAVEPIPFDPLLAKLSKELLFLKTVYEHPNLPFGDLVTLLTNYGDRRMFSIAWDMLDDQGMLDEPWGTTSDGSHCRVFVVCEAGMGFAKTVSERWREIDTVTGGKP